MLTFAVINITVSNTDYPVTIDKIKILQFNFKLVLNHEF